MTPAEQQAYLIKLVRMRMPFGKYENKLLIDLPEYYLTWFSSKGWPKGQIGEMMQIVYETRINGDIDIFKKLRRIAGV